MSEVDNQVESNANEVEQNANEVEQENNVVEQSEDEQGTADQSESTKSDAEKQKILQGQIASAKAKIAIGEKSPSDFPSYLQEHLKDAPRATVKAEDLNNMKDSLLKQLREENQAERVQEIMEEADVSVADKKAYEAEYKELRELGVDPAKAMAKALKLSGVESKLAENRKFAKLKGSMGLPPQGNPRSTESKINWEKQVSDEDAAKFFAANNIKFGRKA